MSDNAPLAPPGARGNQATWWCAALVALSLAVYGPIVRHDFVDVDDDVLIRDNPQFKPVTLGNVLRYARFPHLGGVFPLTYATLASIAVIARGEDGLISPTPFHVVSLVLHSVSVILVFLIVRRLLRRTHDWAAALGAALFSVHPLQVEVVAWATNINALLQAFFSLLAIYLYVAYAQADETTASPRGMPRPALVYAAATLAYAAAMMSKPVAIVLPLVVAVLDVLWIRRDVRMAAAPVGLWLALAVPVALWTKHLMPTPSDVYSPVWLRPIVALDGMAFYVLKVIWPAGTSIDYGRTPRWLLSSTALYWTWTVPVVVAVFLWINRRRALPLVACAAVFVAPLLPVLGLTPFSSQRFSTVADRYLYVPLLGVAAAVAWGVARSPRRAATYAAAAWVVVLACWSGIEVGKWRDTEALFRVTVARNPRSVAGQSALAFIAAKRGQTDAAVSGYRAALDVNPAYTPALYNLANLLRAHGRPDQAIPLYRSALDHSGEAPRLRNNLAVALAETGQLEEADRVFLTALDGFPDYVDALIGRGVVNRQLGRYDVSIAAFERALSIDPNAVLARRGLAQTRAAMRSASTGRATTTTTTTTTTTAETP